MADPVEATASLDGTPSCIAEARRIAGEYLGRVQAVHGLAVSRRAVEVTQLVVSELVTNAMKYAPGAILLQLRIADDTVDVTVWDTEPALPAARAADTGRVGQHGLEIVLAVAQGFTVQQEPVGKRITARIALLDDPDRHVTDRRPQ
ncbi:ATP-binding protein [Streptomyces avermitilis]|uniref:ATP-binding protein n=1 Tax=Streptomyces avermitilis TaxID=33903 RepID=UPI00055D15A0|nr:ATP-binding protein [Streptomyces avermitilis]